MHHRGTFRALAALCLALALSPVTVAAQGAGQDQNADLTATLALPVSPASIALLVGYANEPAAQARVRAALTDPTPNVRAIAARVVIGAGLRMLVPDVRAALKVEQNADAGGQQILAIMRFDPKSFPECVAAAARLGEPATLIAATMFARLESPALLTHLATLEQARTPRPALVDSLGVVTDADPSLVVRLLREFPSSTAAVEVGLATLRKTADRSHDDLLLPLVKSDNEIVRWLTIWHMARVTAAAPASQSFPPDLLAAVASLQAANVTAVSWESLGLELLARVSQQPRHERRWNTLKGSRGLMPKWGADDRKSFGALITDAESADLAPAFFTQPYIITGHAIPASQEPFIDLKPPANPPFGVRMVAPMAGLPWSDLLKLTHCEPNEDGVFARVSYRPDGRPRELSIEPGALTEPCIRAARVLFALTLADGIKPIAPTYTDALILPLSAERVACIDAAAAIPPDRRPTNLSESGPVYLKQPTRTKKVNPVYPESLQKANVQGIVVIEGTISPTGCVAYATIQASPHPGLSAAALEAVLGWKYTPTLLNGVPVPVLMTVTVNFTIQH